MERLNDLTYKIIGCAYQVYNTLGAGLLESVYEEALVYELMREGLLVERQVAVPIQYDGKILATPLRIDIRVNNAVIVELKSVEELKKVHYKQLQTYLKLSGLRIGLLINFNTDNLRDSIHRIII